ncbi:short-chain dehydrogenase/reductase [Gymnopus androsaceus JB14]|uniref:Short-chain dehydrogenase/reductase n=1 Tax=Gymnopus androsaceus JB14 TaxID=1447944 RepID=A0A6A4IAB6_9AGAR|nr:short-chain dehydrogenase/reductase [Gymnopus androsaceus JB14]
MTFSKLTPTYHKDTYPSISPTKASLTQAGKTILITGGGGGIGFETARSFAKASASKVIITGRRAGFLDEALVELRQEFQGRPTEFIAHQADVGSDTSITSLWELLHSQNTLVHVLILNAAHIHPLGPDTLSMDKTALMECFDTNVGGNFLMSAYFVKQILRPTGLKLHLDDVQIISFHPGILYSESVATVFDRDTFAWDKFALPADFSVWAASSEASWLHGRFVWAHWDVDELKSDDEVLRRLQEENGYLKVGIQGFNAITMETLGGP